MRAFALFLHFLATIGVVTDYGSGMSRFTVRLALAWLGVVLAAQVHAVDGPTSETSVAASAVRRIDLETHTPVRVLTRQDFSRYAHLGLGEMLQRLPFMGGSAVNLNSNAEGDGSVSADIGGLGRARCIVMLNGHRLPTNELLATPTVDLNSIPLAFVDRIEIFLGGASPAWGADAVAGVINIITRSEAEGVDLSASSARSTHGDALSHRAGLFGGTVFGRGYFNGSVEYRKQEPLLSTARDFSQHSRALGCLEGPDCMWPYGSSITPEGVFFVPAKNALNVPGGRYTTIKGGDFTPFVAEGPDNDLYSTQTDSYLRAGRTGVSVSARLGYELSSATQLTVDALAARDRSRRQIAALPLTTALDGSRFNFAGPFVALTPVFVAADNYYNPFGVEVPEVRRRLVELGPRDLVDDTDMTFGAATLRHAGDVWQLEAAASWGVSRIVEQTSDVLIEQRLPSALGPSGPDASGAIRCGTPDPVTGVVTNPIEGCVPLDVFNGPGSITADMLDYITGPRRDEARLEVKQASFIARREIGGGTGPATRLALGLETRSLSARFSAPSTGLLRDDQITEGSVPQNDLIAELSWPLRVRDGKETVTLGTGGRLSYYKGRAAIAGSSTIGSGFASLVWRMDEDWLARGRFTQVYRAPSASELFASSRERVVPVSNLCTGFNLASTSVFCTAGDGLVPAPGIVVDSSFIAGGNARLRPETGYSTSFGLAWNSPERLERFVALDATWTRLEDAIRSPNVSELIKSCNSSGLGLCSRILPSITGDAFQFDGTLINGGIDESARLDLEARDGGTTPWGRWRAELFASYLLSRQLVDINGDHLNLRGTFDVTQSITGVAYPIVEAQARLQWSRAPWTAEWSMQYIGSYDEMRDRNGWLTSTGNALRSVDAVIYHDLGFAWALRPDLTVRFNVENVFDRAPPFVNNGLEANTDSPTYRVEGRMLAASFDVSF
jgi:iron complex outermembrane recepter protein